MLSPWRLPVHHPLNERNARHWVKPNLPSLPPSDSRNAMALSLCLCVYLIVSSCRIEQSINHAPMKPADFQSHRSRIRSLTGLLRGSTLRNTYDTLGRSPESSECQLDVDVQASQFDELGSRRVSAGVDECSEYIYDGGMKRNATSTIFPVAGSYSLWPNDPCESHEKHATTINVIERIKACGHNGSSGDSGGTRPPEP